MLVKPQFNNFLPEYYGGACFASDWLIIVLFSPTFTLHCLSYILKLHYFIFFLQVTAIVKDKCKTEFEFKKYQRYVDDMEQVMLLLLNLSSQLARAENKLLDLPGNTTEKEKVRSRKIMNDSQKHKVSLFIYIL